MGNPASAHLEFVGAMAVPLSRENPYFMHFKLAELVFFYIFLSCLFSGAKMHFKKNHTTQGSSIANYKSFLTTWVTQDIVL